MKTLIFNWKMNPLTSEEAVNLARVSDCKNVVIAPPFLFLKKISEILKEAKLGAQDLHWEDNGAFTGEISAAQLKNVGVSYVIIGHSERRHKIGETDETIAKKVAAAVSNGLTAVLCVGETEQERNAGKTGKVIKKQLDIGLSLLNPKPLTLNPIFIAYEPVWAIGTGNNCEPKDALKIIKSIKNILNSKFKIQNSKVLYGGSVNSQNLGDYIKYKEIDGALVGGASLKKDEVKKMALLSAGRSVLSIINKKNKQYGKY